MFKEENLALRRAQRTGVWICLASLLLAALFVSGVWSGSYWALAIPVGVGVLTVLGLGFWVGYTINTVRGIPAEADHFEGESARRIARLLCAACVALAVLFLVGISHGSYLALAIPVAGFVLGGLAMVFWIGWAILTQPPPPEEAGQEAAPLRPAGGAPLGEAAGESAQP